jgi:hypothetical protein
MSRRNRVRYNEKVVFWIDTRAQIHDKIDNTSNSYKYVRSLVNIMLKKKNVKSNRIFFGGEFHDIVSFIAGIVECYQYRDVNIENYTELYEHDIDFN